MRNKAIIALVILAIFGGFGTYLRGYQAEPDQPANFDKIPLEFDRYFGTEHRFAEYAYEILKADTTTLRRYTTPSGKDYWLFVSYFSSQKYGSQIHSPIHCLPGGGYKIRLIEEYPISLADGRTIPARRLVIENQGSQEFMFYWFETRSGIINGEYGLKFDLMKNSLFLMPTDAAFCRITFPVDRNDTLEGATARGVKFIQDIYGYIEDALPFDASGN